MKKTLFVILSLFPAFSVQNVLWGCNQQLAANSKDENRIKEWREHRRIESLPNNAIQLKLDRYFPNNEQEENDVFFQQAMSFCCDEENNFYVSDFKMNLIRKFNFLGKMLMTIGRSGQGPGELSNPLRIRSAPKGDIYVLNSGNDRLERYDKNGKYAQSIKILKSYSDFWVGGTGLIFCNYQSSLYNEENLIEVLDSNGKLVRSFGKRILFKNISRIHNDVLLSAFGDEKILALWEKFNFLRIFSIKGDLLKEINIAYDPFNKISDNNIDLMKPDHGRITSKILFSGIYAMKDKIFLLKTYPRIEIFEVDHEGGIKKIYWYDNVYNYIGNDLVVISKNNKLYFCVLQIFPENRVEIFSI